MFNDTQRQHYVISQTKLIEEQSKVHIYIEDPLYISILYKL